MPRTQRAGQRQTSRSADLGLTRATGRAAREHGIIDALNTAQVPAVADTAYQSVAAMTRIP